eukprot:2672649-Pyramimonas_sp.AAC.1
MWPGALPALPAFGPGVARHAGPARVCVCACVQRVTSGCAEFQPWVSPDSWYSVDLGAYGDV